MRPYIGITGFAGPRDVGTACECAELVPPGWRFMAGILVSAKTLRGETSPRRRYPTLEVAGRLARHLPERAWKVAHFNTRATGDALRDELLRCCDALPAVSGIQLNIVAPDPEGIRRFRERRPDMEIILQVNRAALVDAFDIETGVHAYVEHYYGLAHHALVDFSGGEGVPLDAGLVRRLAETWPHQMRLGAAGGLDASRVSALRGLAVSCDTESRVRTPDDDLDHDRAVAFVRAASSALAPTVAAPAAV